MSDLKCPCGKLFTPEIRDGDMIQIVCNDCMTATAFRTDDLGFMARWFLKLGKRKKAS